jgi:beta-ureidopropionase / N-carbamoyl-L-amino-acid hydrolase
VTGTEQITDRVTDRVTDRLAGMGGPAVDELRVDGERLLTEIAELAMFGGRPDGGVDRVAGSPADLAARAWLGERITMAGLESWTDATGNVFGNTIGGRGPWLLCGSHTDTVPAGGRLDGAYGVLAALEVLRTLHKSRHPAADLLRIVSFWDEEGAQPTSTGGLVGSTALAGDDEHLARLLGYLELHIEQGPRMIRSGHELAVVTGIVGIDRYAVTVTGEANHAGTTPMTDRADAGRAAARTAVRVWDIAHGVGADVVANVGCVDVWPGAPNVIPGRARIIVEFRAASDAALESARLQLTGMAGQIAAAERCTVRIEQLSAIPVTRFDRDLCDLLNRVCRAGGAPTTHLPSYAGHDAGPVSHVLPAAMLFVPSEDGISHSPREHTPDRLLVQGCQALLDTVVEYHRTATHPTLAPTAGLA